MTQNQIIALVRRLISDEQATGYTEGGNLEQPEGTQELLNYLDRAVDEYSKRQAAQKDIRLLKRMSVINGAAIPEDFLGFAGVIPMNIDNGIMIFYGENNSLPVRYFARLPYVTSYGANDELPYQDDQQITIAALAAIYSLNKHEYNISQDLLLMGGIGASNNAAVEQQTQ